MTGFETILIAAALDRRDANVVRHAARFAHAFHAKSVLVAHVEPPLEQAVPGDSSPPANGTAETRLLRLVDSQRGSFPVAAQLSSANRYGARVPELLQLSSERSADLLVLSRRPRDEHDAVSDSVVKLEWKAPCSVLIVPDEAAPVYERILVACDFSAHSLEAVRVAAQLTRSNPAATLTIQHVFALPTATIMAGRSASEIADNLREDARQRWQELAPTLPLADIRYTLRIDESDSVPRAITQAAAELDSQLIVVGSHGRSAAAGALLGHVADTVCGRTTRPFLCVKRKGEVVDLLQSLLGLYRR